MLKWKDSNEEVSPFINNKQMLSVKGQWTDKMSIFHIERTTTTTTTTISHFDNVNINK